MDNEAPPQADQTVLAQSRSKTWPFCPLFRDHKTVGALRISDPEPGGLPVSSRGSERSADPRKSAKSNCTLEGCQTAADLLPEVVQRGRGSRTVFWATLSDSSKSDPAPWFWHPFGVQDPLSRFRGSALRSDPRLLTGNPPGCGSNKSFNDSTNLISDPSC